jgi:hypothetical protein
MSEHFSKTGGFTWQVKGNKKGKNGQEGQKGSFLPFLPVFAFFVSLLLSSRPDSISKSVMTSRH